jgi:hypothetical protein
MLSAAGSSGLTEECLHLVVLRVGIAFLFGVSCWRSEGLLWSAGVVLPLVETLRDRRWPAPEERAPSPNARPVPTVRRQVMVGVLVVAGRGTDPEPQVDQRQAWSVRGAPFSRVVAQPIIP